MNLNENFRITDLSLGIYHGAPTFAYDPKCAVIIHNTIPAIGYNITQLSLSSHQGTHLDAPYHFFDDGVTVDQLAPEQFAGPCIKVDLSSRQSKQPLVVEDFLPYAARIRKSRVIVQTGWDKVFPEPRYFTDFPYVSIDLAEWFAERQIILLGLDIPTPNPVDWMKVHHILLGHNVIIVEGLANLDQVASQEFYFIAAPLKILGRDGSPVRALALEGRN